MVNPVPMPLGTLLIMDTIGVPLYSARGLTQTYTPIAEAKGNVVRDCNGGLMDLTYSQFQKLQTKISCKDNRVPSLSCIPIGTLVNMSCIQLMTYPIGGSPPRPVKPSSSFTDSDSGFVFFLPILQVRLLDYNVAVDEWTGSSTWDATFEEE